MKFSFGSAKRDGLLQAFLDGLGGGRGDGGPKAASGTKGLSDQGWKIFGNGPIDGQQIDGTDGDDSLNGTSLDDHVSGKSGDDSIFGFAGDDNLDGNEGDDLIEGGAGNDEINGNDGFDTAVYDGSILDFSFTPASGGANKTIVTDLNIADGDAGTDELKNIEAMQFNDFLYLIGQDNAPLATSTGGTTNEDAPGTFVVNGYDFEGDALQAPVVTYGGPGVVTLVSTTPLAPAVGVGAAYTFEFDPNGQFETLGAGQDTVETISVAVTDANGNTTSVDVDVTITGVNDAPVANDDTASTDEDTATTIDVLGNDTDVDTGDTLEVTDASAANGTVVIQGDGSLLYTPNLNFNGIDTITYEVTDSGGLTDTATVEVTVNPVNDAPQSLDIPLTINEADGVKIIDLSTQAIDVDGDALTFDDIALTRDSQPIPFQILGDGLIRIDPADIPGLGQGESIEITFRYTVTDDSGAGNNSDTGFVPVTINGGEDAPPPVNSPPVAGPLSVVADEEDGPVQVSLADLVSDPDVGDVLTITSLTWDNGGSPVPISFGGGVTGGDGGSLTFDPVIFGLEEGETATISLTYVVEDAAGLTATNIITLVLTGDTPGAGNTPPVAASLAPTEIIVDDPEATTQVVNLFALVSDAETADTGLIITIGGLEIGFDEATGQPILADGALSYNAVTGDLTIDLTAIPVPDGETLRGTISYEVSDGTDSAKGELVFDYVNPADGPVGPVTTILDFEEFAWTDPAVLGLVLGSQGFTFQGSATVVETDELGGDGRAPTGLVLGQTTAGGDNVLVGTYSTTTTLVEVLDEEGQPVKDEEGNPVLEVVEVLDKEFAILAPNLALSIGGPGQIITTTSPGQSFAVPEGLGESFDLNGLSLNPAQGGEVTVTITLYTIGVVEVPNANFPTVSDYSAALIEVDSFVFVVDSGTDATQIDFEAEDFGIGMTGANTTPEIFDDIYAVQITTDDGTAVVIDDAILTL